MDFVAVYFGNVAEPNASAKPLLKHQIAVDEPVTVTDKRIIRYFIAIPKAAQLYCGSGYGTREQAVRFEYGVTSQNPGFAGKYDSFS